MQKLRSSKIKKWSTLMDMMNDVYIQLVCIALHYEGNLFSAPYELAIKFIIVRIFLELSLMTG